MPPSASASEAPVVAPGQPTVENGRLSALRDALASGVTDAEAQFWSAVKVAGTPIVESTEDHPGEARVTFLWKGDDQTRSVRLISGPQIISKFKNLGFRRLDDTEVWFLTLHVPSGMAGVGYMLVENAEQRGYPSRAGRGWLQQEPIPSITSTSRRTPPPQRPLISSYSIFETPGAPPESPGCAGTRAWSPAR